MRYHHLREAIVNRPRNLDLYLTNRIKALDNILARLSHAKELVKANARDGDGVLRTGLRYGAPDENLKDVASATYGLEYLDLDRRYELTHLRDNLETYLKYKSDPRYDFLQYVFSTLKYVEPVDKDTRTTLSLLPYAEAGFAEYGWRVGHPDDEADPEYQAAKRLLSAYRIMAACLPQIEQLEADIVSKLGVIRDIKGSLYGKYRPQHEAVETLYHATAFVPEILREGFQAEPPEDRRGLGNFGHQYAISFTHDLELARNIMRTLKEMWMIAHGQLTGPTIMRWAQAEGIQDELKKMWANMTSRPIPSGRNADPKDVAYLYRYWLSASKLRDDPMMTYPEKVIETMLSRSLKDIGVLACEVRLTPEDQYMIGESEFRVQPDRVISAKQVM